MGNDHSAPGEGKKKNKSNKGDAPAAGSAPNNSSSSASPPRQCAEGGTAATAGGGEASSSGGGGSVVVLNVYNLQNQPSGQKEATVNGKLGFGFYHTGLEVFGLEWTFGGNPEAEENSPGIFPAYPKTVLPPSQFYESITLGVLPPTVQMQDLIKILHEMHKDWRAVTYHLLSHNCNHFTAALRDALVEKLHVKLQPIPSYINRAARVADFFVPESLYRAMMKRVPQSTATKASAPESRPQQMRPESGTTTTASASSSDQSNAIPTNESELRAMSVRQLKTLMWLNGVSSTGCIEKADLVERLLLEAQRRQRQQQSQPQKE